MRRSADALRQGFSNFALDVSPLRESVPYRALWVGQIVSLIGTQMRYVAVPWQVFQITDSVVAVGLIGLAEVVPLIVFSIVGGAVADRMDRRTVMLRSQVGLIVTSLALASVSFGDQPPVAWIYALTALASAINSFDRPARTAIVPNLVGPAKMPAALALRQIVFQTTQIAGPGLGGILIATFDVAWVYLIDAVTFVASIVALRWVPSSIPDAVLTDSRLIVIREGLAFAFRDPLILSVFAIDLIAMIFGMPRAVFPALAERTFHMGAEGVGLLFAAPSVGALVAALSAGWVGRVRRQGAAVLIAVAVWGTAITLAGVVLPSLPLTLLFLALAGGADVFSAVFRGTMLQVATPDRLRGRVSALNLMVVTGGPRLGDVEAGLVAGVIGAPASVVVGGLACLLGTGFMALTRPLKSYVVAHAEKE